MNLWNLAYMAGALAAGMLIPVQTGYNTQLGRALHGPLYSSIAVFAVGLVTILIAIVVVRAPIPPLDAATKAPTIAWIVGGLFAALYTLALTMIAPRLGAAATVAFVVSGQLLCSTVIDHFGLLGFQSHSASPLRLLGLALIAGGVTMVRMF